jgi:hypothetical protein
MTTQRLGGYLLLAGALTLGVSIVLLALYGGIGLATVPGLSLGAALALLGAGGLVTTIAGSRPLGSLATRVGVGILSFGLVSMAAFSFMSGFVPGDPLASLPMVIAGGLGYLAIPAGLLLTVISAVWHALRRASAGRSPAG